MDLYQQGTEVGEDGSVVGGGGCGFHMVLKSSDEFIERGELRIEVFTHTSLSWILNNLSFSLTVCPPH